MSSLDVCGLHGSSIPCDAAVRVAQDVPFFGMCFSYNSKVLLLWYVHLPCSMCSMDFNLWAQLLCFVVPFGTCLSHTAVLGFHHWFMSIPFSCFCVL